MAFRLDDLNYEKDSKERMPWEHYKEQYSASDPGQIAQKLGIPFDEDTKNVYAGFPWNRIPDFLAGF